jgi:heme-degrading monooxygenase HmoA/hemerythrin-like domain-containing protein
MIFEVADIRIISGCQAEFEQAAHHGIQTVIAKSKGFLGYRVLHCIDSPERYLLLLEWDTLEDHTVGFRGSAAYAQWQKVVVDFVERQPFVERFTGDESLKIQHNSALDQPIQEFSDCHVDVVNMLDDLTALSRQRDPPHLQREVAGRILGFFRDVVTPHHHEEEAELFPAVLADATAGNERAQVEGLVNRLVDEHRRIESTYAQLAPTLSAIESGHDVSLDAPAVAALVANCLAHARFEEEMFLPLAQTILGRNSDHMAALGLALHIRHASNEVRRKFGFI